jgi:hypothetical protein
MSEPEIPANNHTLIPNHGTLIATDDIQIRGERRLDKLAKTVNESATKGIKNSKYGIKKHDYLERLPNPKSAESGLRSARLFFPNLRLGAASIVLSTNVSARWVPMREVASACRVPRAT